MRIELSNTQNKPPMLFSRPVNNGTNLESLSLARAPRKTKEALDSERGTSIRDLLAVQFPANDKQKDLAASFNAVVYPAASNSAIAKEVPKLIYRDFIEYLGTASFTISNAFALLKYIAIEGRAFTLYNRSVEEQQEDALRKWSSRTMSPALLADVVKKTMGVLSKGRSHIVVPSKKYRGGYDVVFSGVPGSLLNADSSAGTQHFMANSTKSGAYQRLVDEGASLTTDVAKAAIEASNKLLDELLKGQDAHSIQSTFKRSVSTVDINFNFQQAIEKAFGLFFTKTGIKLPEVVVPKPDSILVEKLTPFFSIVIVKEPIRELVNIRLNNPDLPEDSLNIPKETPSLNVDVALSFCMHLPIEAANYITQTADGERFSLSSLNTWATVWSNIFLRPPKSKTGGAGVIAPRNAPKYILSATKTPALLEKRKKLGYYTETGRNDDSNMFIASDGTMNYLPKSDQLVAQNAADYERILDEALELSYEAGSPLAMGQMGVTDPVFALASPQYKEKIADVKKRVAKYGGSLQTYSWDYNTVLTTSTDEPDKIVASSLQGAARPNSLTIADYLRQPFGKGLSLMLANSYHLNSEGRPVHKVLPADFGGHSESDVASMLSNTSTFINFFKLYTYLLSKQLVPEFQDLVNEAASEMDIKNLNDKPHDVYERGLYGHYITPDLKVSSDDTVLSIIYCLSRVLMDASAGHSSNITRALFLKEAEEGKQDPEEDPHFFNSRLSSMHEFKRVFNYLGGRVFYEACKHVAHTDLKHLMVIDPDSDILPAPFASLVTEVMPMVTLMTKYIPESDRLLEEADKEAESLVTDESLDESDIKVPGSREGFQMFPHQVEAMRILMGRPKFAILDISAGGGKTMILLTDLAMLVGGGHVKRPLIMCPGRLVKNWIEDMHKATEGKWNFIPLTTEVYKRWGEEKLIQMIANAPPNTICVVGNSLLANIQSTQFVIGRHVENISPTLELIKRFGFDYMGIDESHRTKNVSSKTHKMAKELSTASCLKYLRLATGSLISNTLKDIVGQAALNNAQCFRTPQEFEDENMSAGKGLKGKMYLVYLKKAAKEARDKLSKFASVITFKRREWAFMLPIPIETIHFVTLSKRDKEGDLIKNGDAHQMMYDALEQISLEAIKNDKKLMDKLTGKKGAEDDEGEGDLDDDDDEKSASDVVEDALDDQDESVIEALGAALQPYLARLEMAITDPMGDHDIFGNKFGEPFFKGLAESKFVSSKVEKIIDLIKSHYVLNPWKKGDTYKLHAVVDINGARYKLFNADDKEDYVSIKSPDLDTDHWKPEALGKILVFCRYTRSVEAIYRALPAEFKKVARRFHGDIKERWANLEQFKSTPISPDKGVQILISNEQAISEGHNLQMASRLIRVELPWAPGELDQAQSRIFRPDPSNKFKRDTIYLDWVLADGTLDVTKFGRLISKMLTKTEFDEADNDFKTTYQGQPFGYQDLNKQNLPALRLDLRSLRTLKWRENLSEIVDGEVYDYIGEYQKLAMVQGREFAEMKKTKPSKMVDIEPTPMMEGSKHMEFQPYVDDLELPDPNNFGLVGLNVYLQNESDPEVHAILNDKTKLTGRYVHTEFGNGVIQSVRTETIKDPSSSDKNKSKSTPISSIKVQLAGTGEVMTFEPSLVWLAENLTEKTVKLFAPKVKWMSFADKRRVESEEKQRLRRERRMEQRAQEEYEAEKREKSRAQRLIDRKLGGTGDIVSRRTPKVQPVEKPAVHVSLFPVVYNGFIALECTNDEGVGALKKFGFRSFGDYAYMVVNNLQNFTAVYAALTKKFAIPSSTKAQLEELHDSFQTGRGRKFAVELSQFSEFKNFYMLSHKLARVETDSGKPELKVYPVVINKSLMLVVDLATNPAMKRLLGKTIPNTTLKFEQASGLEIAFFPTKSKMVETIKAVRAAKIVIDNFDELKEEVQNLKLKMPTASDVPAKPVKKEVSGRTPVKAPVVKSPVKVAPKTSGRTPVKAPVVKSPTKVAPKTSGKTPVKAPKVKTPVAVTRRTVKAPTVAKRTVKEPVVKSPISVTKRAASPRSRGK